MINNVQKKVWVTPTLEILDSKKTYGGGVPSFSEMEGYAFGDES